MADTHYVLVIHGTWNPPNPTSPTWHQLNESDPQNFCTKLNDELELLGFGRSVWRQVNGQAISFGWSGVNQHAARVVAGEDLCKLILSIVAQDPSARIHFVAHSHGANVLLHALSLYLETLRSDARVIFGKVRQEVLEADIIAALSPVTGILPSIVREFLEQLGIGLAEVLFDGLDWFHIRSPYDKTTTLRKALDRAVQVAIGQAATHRLIQSLPDLNVKTFANMWMAFHPCNRVGRLVFLGSPFFKKTWIRSAWWRPGVFLAVALNLIVAIFLGLLASYGTINKAREELWNLNKVWGEGPWFHGKLKPQPDPRAWPTWLQVAGGGFAFLGGMFVFYFYWTRTRQDVSPYFKIEDFSPCSAEASPWFPFRTQIIHAELLDEAFLGYSAEPLVYGALAPQVQSLLNPRLSFTVEGEQIGESFAPSNAFIRYVAVPLRCLLWLVTKVTSPATRMLERRLVTRLLQIVSSPAYGLPAREFSNAVYMISHKIDQPQFFIETTWDVGRELLASAPKRDSTMQAEINRYRFLWDDTERKRRMNSSWLRDQLQTQMPHILARYHGLPDVDAVMLQKRIINTSLVLEERMKEIMGTVELMHSSYYTNETVIRGIARFLATGKNAMD